VDRGRASAEARERHATGECESDFSFLVDRSTPRRTVSDAARQDGLPVAPERNGQHSDRLVGTLVHRLLQHLGFEASHASEPLARIAFQLLRGDETEAGDTASTIDAAVAAYRAICGRADLRAIYAAGECRHEVPFTMPHGGAILRGTIDCLIVAPSGTVTLVEIKTGRSQGYHQAQLDLYRRAAEDLFPGVSVDTLLVYAAAGSSASILHDRPFDEDG